MSAWLASSHVVFSLRAWWMCRRSGRDHDVVYATVPLNLLALLVFRTRVDRLRIVDVVDIWPDVLPFPRRVRQLFWPLFVAWRSTFRLAVTSADLLLTVSDRFLNESMPAFRGVAGGARRVYIGHPALPHVSRVPGGALTIAYVGNIGRVYDFDTLVDAMANCGRAVRLLLIGDGNRCARLRGLLDRRGVPHEYFGVVYDAAALAAILARADLGFNGYVGTSAAFSSRPALTWPLDSRS